MLPRKYLAAVSNPILGRGHLGTQLARSHTEWPIKEMITSGLSLLQTHFPGQNSNETSAYYTVTW
jgi:hypothetical protein